MLLETLKAQLLSMKVTNFLLVPSNKILNELAVIKKHLKNFSLDVISK